MSAAAGRAAALRPIIIIIPVDRLSDELNCRRRHRRLTAGLCRHISVTGLNCVPSSSVVSAFIELAASAGTLQLQLGAS